MIREMSMNTTSRRKCAGRHLHRYVESVKAALAALLVLGLLSSATSATSAAVVPGTGTRVAALSDDFEDPGWGFDYSTYVSSNGLWTGSSRGAPEILNPVAPPSGGLSGSTRALQIRTWEAVDPSFDNWDANNPEGQEDFFSRWHNQRFGRLLTPADYPSMTMRVHMPDIAEWMGYPRYDLGFRAEVDSVGPGPYNIGKHYSSIWFYKKTDGKGYVYIRDSIGDRQAVALNRPGPQWYTLGFSWDSAGSHFYFWQGVADLTASDKIGDDTEPLVALNYHFVTIATLAKNTLSPDDHIDDVSVFAAGWARDPSPADGAADAAENAVLSWTAGLNASSHAVYFGTTPELGTADLKAMQPGTSYNPGALDWGTTYYWRIDETNPIGVSTGLVWSFTTATPALATNTLPYAESFEAYAAGERPSPGEGWTPASHPGGEGLSP